MRRQLAAALLGAALLTGGAQAVAEPTAARYVADEADVLSSETEQYIIDKNQSLFEDTGGEIVVVSVDFMDGMDAADYAMAVAESWGGIGDESLNNGFLLVYAVGENKVWAMAGSGIEDALPASKIEGWLEADFYGGYDAGEYDSATRAFFDDVYGWYESYYGTSAGSVVPSEPGRDFVYYPEPENDYVFAVVGQMGLFLLIRIADLPILVHCYIGKDVISSQHNRLSGCAQYRQSVRVRQHIAIGSKGKLKVAVSRIVCITVTAPQSKETFSVYHKISIAL